jgi:hypothetical protein
MDDKCIIIGNKFANMVQILVFVLSVSALFLHKIFIENDLLHIYSRTKEIIYNQLCNRCKNNIEIYTLNPRNWSVWFMDNIKQGLSTLAGHFWAIYAAKLLSNNNSDECAWFIIQFLVDTLIAIILSFILCKLSIKLISLISKPFAVQWLTIGNYDTTYFNNKYKIWIFQTIHWLLCSIIARIVCTYIILGGYEYFIIINNWFTNFWIHKRDDELILVTLVIPIIMNTIQLLIQNWFLRWKNMRNEKMHENRQRLIHIV